MNELPSAVLELEILKYKYQKTVLEVSVLSYLH